jgi:DNA-binding NarL/FixJ family response regulator
MLEGRGKLLIADGDDLIRTSLSLIFSELGYRVLDCAQGFSALSEISKETPDVLLSSVNPAAMPDQEFLLVVRRWFPSIRVIVMGAAFADNQVPPGVAADAIWHKDDGLDCLIAQVEAMTQPKRSASRLSLEKLFGFTVFEVIPSRSDAAPLTFPPDPTIVFPILQNGQTKEFIPQVEAARAYEASSR